MANKAPKSSSRRQLSPLAAPREGFYIPNPKYLIYRTAIRVADWMRSAEARALNPFDDKYYPTSRTEVEAAGVKVTEESALTLTAFACGVKVLSDVVGMLNLHLYQKRDGKRERSRSDPLYRRMRWKPNPLHTAFRYRHVKQGHALTWGNGYSYLERGPDGRALDSYPLRPDRMEDMKVVRIPGVGQRIVYYYRYSATEAPRPIPQENIVHIRNSGGDGLRGYSVVKQFGKALGISIAAEESAASFYGNQTRPAGGLRVPEELSDTAYDRLKKSWAEAHEGPANAWRTAILEGGAEWQQIGFPHEEQVLIGMQQFNIENVARMLNIPLHLLHHLLRATFSNIHDQQLHFLQHSADPWLVNWEQELNTVMIADDQLGETYLEFDRNSLLRMSPEARNKAYREAIAGGWMCADDVRDRESMNPIPDGSGKLYRWPVQNVPSSVMLDDPSPPAPRQVLPARAEDAVEVTTNTDLADGRRVFVPGPRRTNADGFEERRRIARAWRRPYTALGDQILRRERADVLSNARKKLHLSSFGPWLENLEQWYRGHGDWIEAKAYPSILGLTESIVPIAAAEVSADPDLQERHVAIAKNLGRAMASRIVYGSFGQLRKVAREAAEAANSPTEETVIAALEAEFDAWAEETATSRTRAARIADRETVLGREIVARDVFVSAGRTRTVWRAHGTSCPYCDNLNGKTIGVTKAFVEPGPMSVGRLAVTLTVKRQVLFAPLHKGCDCGTSPE